MGFFMGGLLNNLLFGPGEPSGLGGGLEARDRGGVAAADM